MMYTLNLIMSALMAATIIAATVKGEVFLRWPYRVRITVAIILSIVFGGWIVLANLV